MIMIRNLIQMDGEIARYLRVAEALVSRVRNMHLHRVTMQV
uniref:Uncharacterized protein n=1 Tax=Arundo donax TaxID=35708 RepID=A0A0A9EY97_ARUDO